MTRTTLMAIKYDCTHVTVAKVVDPSFKLRAQWLTKRWTDLEKEMWSTISVPSSANTAKSSWDNASLNVVPIAKNTDEFTVKQDAVDFFFLHSTQGNCHNQEDLSNTLEKGRLQKICGHAQIQNELLLGVSSSIFDQSVAAKFKSKIQLQHVLFQLFQSTINSARKSLNKATTFFSVP